MVDVDCWSRYSRVQAQAQLQVQARAGQWATFGWFGCKREVQTKLGTPYSVQGATTSTACLHWFYLL